MTSTHPPPPPTHGTVLYSRTPLFERAMLQNRDVRHDNFFPCNFRNPTSRTVVLLTNEELLPALEKFQKAIFWTQGPCDGREGEQFHRRTPLQLSGALFQPGVASHGPVGDALLCLGIETAVVTPIVHLQPRKPQNPYRV